MPQPTLQANPFNDDKLVFRWPKKTKCLDGQLLGMTEMIAESPFGGVGTHLYVRETWANWEREPGFIIYRADNGGVLDTTTGDQWQDEGALDCREGDRWRPSIHMPKWASRITLLVEREWAERVQEISEEDAVAEGPFVQPGDSGIPGPGYKWHGDGYRDVKTGLFHTQSTHNPHCWCTVGQSLQLAPAICAYHSLWDSLYAKKGFGWDDNPWVFGCEFKVLEVKG